MLRQWLQRVTRRDPNRLVRCPGCRRELRRSWMNRDGFCSDECQERYADAAAW